MKPLQVVSLVLAGVAIIAAVIATAIDYWIYTEVSTPGTHSEAYMGLWQACAVSGSQKQCYEMKNDGSWKAHESDYEALQACRGLMIIGLVLMAVAIPLVFMKVTSKVVAPICMVVGGVCCLAAAIVYGVKFYGNLPEVSKQITTLHAGFGLAIVASGLSFLAGGTMCIAAREGQTGFTFAKF